MVFGGKVKEDFPLHPFIVLIAFLLAPANQACHGTTNSSGTV